MPVDIEVGELTTAGLVEPHAEWTDQSSKSLSAALREELLAKQATLVQFQIPAGQSFQKPRFDELVKLHQAVAQTILTHQFNMYLHLPTKKEDTLDWSLGADAQLLGERYNADYAMFIYVQDIYSSKGRMGIVILAALLQLNPFMFFQLPGAQFGYVSLVDLRTGDVVWFHRFMSRTGDLRDQESAQDVVEDLLEDLPL